METNTGTQDVTVNGATTKSAKKHCASAVIVATQPTVSIESSGEEDATKKKPTKKEATKKEAARQSQSAPKAVIANASQKQASIIEDAEIKATAPQAVEAKKTCTPEAAPRKQDVKRTADISRREASDSADTPSLVALLRSPPPKKTAAECAAEFERTAAETESKAAEANAAQREFAKSAAKQFAIDFAKQIEARTQALQGQALQGQATDELATKADASKWKAPADAARQADSAARARAQSQPSKDTGNSWHARQASWSQDSSKSWSASGSSWRHDSADGGWNSTRGKGSWGRADSAGGGGGSTWSGGNDSWRATQLSKALSMLLRHKALELGVAIRPDGYCLVDDVLSVPSMKSLQATKADIEDITNTNDKKRFQLSTVDGQLMVRAVQGHSMKVVEDEKLLVRISPQSQQLPSKCVHGTYSRNWVSIQHQGLIAGGGENNSWGKKQGMVTLNRNHIHFAPFDYTDKRVISGMRPNCDVAIYLDLPLALSAGIAFFTAENEVILTPGESGVIHPKYFKTVKNILTGEILHGKA